MFQGEFVQINHVEFSKTTGKNSIKPKKNNLFSHNIKGNGGAVNWRKINYRFKLANGLFGFCGRILSNSAEESVRFFVLALFGKLVLPRLLVDGEKQPTLVDDDVDAVDELECFNINSSSSSFKNSMFDSDSSSSSSSSSRIAFSRTIGINNSFGIHRSRNGMHVLKYANRLTHGGIFFPHKY